MRKETKEYIRNILDTMSGSDGGVRFVKFKIGIEEFDRRATKGDKDAQAIIQVVRHFSRLIDTLVSMLR